MKLFRDLLEAHGYQTSGTSNGFRGLDLCSQACPDLILMDIQLPQVSGLEVTRWIKMTPELRSTSGGSRHGFADEGGRGTHSRGRLARLICPSRSWWAIY